MARRNMYGPKRIAVQQTAAVQDAGRIPQRKTAGKSSSQKEFMSIPDTSVLRPAGHSRIDCSVRFVMQGKGYFDLRSSYGTLRIAPLADDIIRISFAKGENVEFPDCLSEYKTAGFRYRKRENPSVIEFLTKKVIVHIDKKTGAVSFMNPQGKLLLSENQKMPRQIDNRRVWMYFDWTKAEKLQVRGLTDKHPQRTDMTFARYISYGRENERSPGVISENGYELLLPPGVKLLCCRIPTYGPYLCVEGKEVIDYYFRVL